MDIKNNIVYHSESEIMEILHQDNTQMESVNVCEEASFASQVSSH